MRYAQASARMAPITEAIYNDLAAHFSAAELVQISFVVGLASMVNRFHGTFLTEVDPVTQEAITAGGACPIRVPAPPGASHGA